MRCWALYVREAKRAKMCYTDRTDDAVQYLKRFKFSSIKKVSKEIGGKQQQQQQQQPQQQQQQKQQQKQTTNPKTISQSNKNKQTTTTTTKHT